MYPEKNIKISVILNEVKNIIVLFISFGKLRMTAMPKFAFFCILDILIECFI